MQSSRGGSSTPARRSCCWRRADADLNPAIHDPGRLFELWDSEQDWGYRTVPQAACAGRELHWPRGKVLGGSSALNGMIYARGHRSDYDTWAYLGNEGWGYDDVLPLFKRSEDFDRGESALPRRGRAAARAVALRAAPGPSPRSRTPRRGRHPVQRRPQRRAARGRRVLPAHDQGRRAPSTAVAFLAPVADAPNLTVLTGAHAQRLLFEGERCAGVEVVRDGEISRIRAEGEVIVCGGTVESPKLLLLSGIGAADELARLGIGVVADVPGVGRNLHDHLLSPVIHAASQPVPPPLPGLQPLHSHLFAHSRPGLPGPDIQPLFFHLPLYLEGMEGPPDGYTLMAGAIRPASRGTLRLASADPSAPPLIDPAFLACDVDVDALVAAIELCREIGGQAALDGWRDRELYPGPGVQTRKELRDYVRGTAITYHHQVGTCKMGVDDQAVVDPQLRVRGVEGLRVADASVMPFVSSGNTHAPTLMIGERAADLVSQALGSRAATARA